MTFGRRTLRWTGPALAALVILLVALPSLPTAAARTVSSTPAASFSPVSLDSLAGYSGTFAARAGYEAGQFSSVSDPAPAAGQELVVVAFRPTDPTFFAPPAAGHTLSVAEIAERYGLSPTAYASAEAYFESMGLSVVHSGGDRLMLTVSGSAPALGHAFGTDLTSGTYEGRRVTFPSSPPSLPASLESSVAAVVGLSSGFDTFSLPTGLASAGSGGDSGPYDLIYPAIAREIYDFSQLYNVSGSPRYASGEKIALLLWGDGYDPNDLATFFSNEYPPNFPAASIAAFPVDGAPEPSANAPSDPSKAPEELTLDLEWAGSMAPGATLDAVYAPDGPAPQNYSPTVASMTDALTEAVTGIPGVSVISMSFGTPEDASQPLAAAWSTDLAAATQEGITLLAATGDSGGVSGAACQGTVSTNYPADSTDVLAVGGTVPALSRNLLGQVTGLASESAWSGSGGGFSTNTAAPSWQEVGSAAAPVRANGHRGVPDVAATAAYNYFYYAGTNQVAAGTSFATPLWAGLVAEMDSLYGARLGFLTPRLYAVGAAQETGKDPVGLADITSGSNCVASAKAGWDTVTGWGSPRALLLYEDLTATFVDLSVSSSPSTVAPGGTVTVVARLTNQSSGTPISGVPVAVSLAATSSAGPCAGVWGSETLTSNATGFVRLAVTVPACFLGAHGTTDVSVASDGYYGANSTTFDVNLLGFVPALLGIERFPGDVIAFGVIMAAAIAVGYVLGRGRRQPTPATLSRPPVVPPGASAPPPTPPTPPAPSSPPPSSPNPPPPPAT